MMVLTSTALDGKGSQVTWDLTEVQLTLPLQGFWVAVIKCSSTKGQLQAPSATTTPSAPSTVGGSSSQPLFIEVDPAAGSTTYPSSGTLYDPQGNAYTAPQQAPAWVYAGLSAYQPVVLTLGSVSFHGVVVRSGIWGGQVSLLVQAGLTKPATYPGGGFARIGDSVYSILQALAKASNVTLSPTIDVTGLSALSLNFQPAATLRLSDTLTQLVLALDAAAGPQWAATQAGIYSNPSLWPAAATPVPDLYHWRFLPDGTLWVGLDFYPFLPSAGNGTLNNPVLALSTKNPDPSVATWIDCAPQQGRDLFGVTDAVLLPGDTYIGPQTPYSLPWPLTGRVSPCCGVEYHWTGLRLKMEVLNGSANSPVLSVVPTLNGGQTISGGW